jgi:hypothetical protein
MQLRRTLSASLIVIAAATATAARAQDSAEVAAARDLGQKGTFAAQSGHCDEAIDLLTRARAIMAVPTVLTPLGECEIKV